MEYRRNRGDMIQVYKIIKGLDRLESNKFFKFAHYSKTRGHSKKLYKKTSFKDVRKNVFSQRIINDWNSLNEEIVSAETLGDFKSKPDLQWRDRWYKVSYET